MSVSKTLVGLHDDGWVAYDSTVHFEGLAVAAGKVLIAYAEGRVENAKTAAVFLRMWAERNRVIFPHVDDFVLWLMESARLEPMKVDRLRWFANFLSIASGSASGFEHSDDNVLISEVGFSWAPEMGALMLVNANRWLFGNDT